MRVGIENQIHILRYGSLVTTEQILVLLIAEGDKMIFALLRRRLRASSYCSSFLSAFPREPRSRESSVRRACLHIRTSHRRLRKTITQQLLQGRGERSTLQTPEEVGRTLLNSGVLNSAFLA